MFARVRGVRIGYHVSGEGETIVLLHGWGGDSRSFFPIHQRLSKSYQVYSIDFPGFGRSALPPEPWGVGDYAEVFHDWMDAVGIRRATLIGHSFGGRVSIVTATRWPERINRLVLVDSAGIRPRRTFGYHLRVAAAKAGRKALASPVLAGQKAKLEPRLYRALGASDYASAGPLRPTFVKVVNEELRPLLPQIAAPTLLVWGDQDQDTPIADARVMEQEIPGARLIVYEGAGHFAYLERQDSFCDDVERFLAAD